MLVIEQHRKGLGAVVAVAEIQGSVPAEFFGVLFCGRRFAACDFWLRDRQKCKLFGVSQLPEYGVDGHIHDAQGRCRRMPEVEKLVAIGKVKKPCADSVEADFGTSRQEITADVGRGRVGRFLAGSILHSVVMSDSKILR